MSFHRDYRYIQSGGTIGFLTSPTVPTPTKRAASLPRNQSLVLPFHVVDGMVKINVSSLHYRNPTDERVLGPAPDPTEPTDGRGSVTEVFNQIPFEVELFDPLQEQPVASWSSDDEGWNEIEGYEFRHTVSGSATGEWKCIVMNKGNERAQVSIAITCFFDRQGLRSQPIPLQLLGHAFRLILEALTPSARIFQNQLHVSFGAELQEYFGSAGSGILGDRQIDLPDNVQATGRMLSFYIEPTSGRTLLEAMEGRWRSNNDALNEQLSHTTDFFQRQALQTKIDENNNWRDGWQERIDPDFVTIHSTVAFSKIMIDLELDLLITEWEIDLADIESFTLDIFVAFNTTLEDGFPLVLSNATFSGGVADVAEYLGLIKDVNEYIEEKLPTPIEEATQLMGRYLGEAMVRLCLPDGVFMELIAENGAWVVKYTAEPGPRSRIIVRPADAGVDPIAIDFDADPEPLGEIPPEFLIQSRSDETLGQTLTRLDEIGHIVVIMMENRSFDHILGYLRTAGRADIDGLIGNEFNLTSSRTDPVRVEMARDVVEGVVTQIIYGPHHKHVEVMNQIDKGTMKNFAENYDKRYPNIGIPEYVMSYYTGNEVPTYHTLAAEFGVCDHWFSAFPGGTWPNRWILFTGTTPECNNYEIDDPRIGYIPGPTIFEVLDATGIEWRLFESDLSVLRTYAQYRLNSTNVIPLKRRPTDTFNDFFDLASAGNLPAITFIEPNFSDIPPLSTANDDLCPVDLRRGQSFIAEIYNALRTSPIWDDMMLIITYDEHGGFYDHVPPPGTDADPRVGEDAIPLVHALAPHHLGVRVPAFVVSPYISAGAVCKTEFDHTSILKTILVRYRNDLTASQMTRFGKRVNKAAHLGLALDLDSPRRNLRHRQLPTKFERQVLPWLRNDPKEHYELYKFQGDDFQFSIRRSFLPASKNPR
ncbi:MAG: alkaline phosphatase family protein [Pyrinomonadaceae bacterium]